MCNSVNQIPDSLHFRLPVLLLLTMASVSKGAKIFKVRREGCLYAASSAGKGHEKTEKTEKTEKRVGGLNSVALCPHVPLTSLFDPFHLHTLALPSVYYALDWCWDVLRPTLS